MIVSRKKDDKEVISRHHAKIIYDSNEWYIIDMTSLNGTFVNDIKVGKSRLADGDTIQFGGAANTSIGGKLNPLKSDVNIKYKFSSHSSPHHNYGTPVLSAESSFICFILNFITIFINFSF